MFRRSKLFHRQCVLAAFLMAAVAAPAFAAARSIQFAPLSNWDLAALERARAGAAIRLQGSECQRVLSDFADPQGRTLLANLEPWQRTPSDYLLQAITFLDGSTLMDCRKSTVPLATSPGQLGVFVCPVGGATPGSRFSRIQVENPNLAEIMIIHEMLHTLGLGENPPTTFEITDRVMARCR
jgi:hypothetical protein